MQFHRGTKNLLLRALEEGGRGCFHVGAVAGIGCESSETSWCWNYYRVKNGGAPGTFSSPSAAVHSDFWNQEIMVTLPIVPKLLQIMALPLQLQAQVKVIISFSKHLSLV